jgi:hypothetical protein
LPNINPLPAPDYEASGSLQFSLFTLLFTLLKQKELSFKQIHATLNMVLL